MKNIFSRPAVAETASTATVERVEAHPGQVGTPVPVALSCLQVPIALGAGTERALVKVDRVVRFGSDLIVSGWTAGAVSPALEPAAELYRFERTDVADHLGESPDAEHGFALITRDMGESGVAFRAVADDETSHREVLAVDTLDISAASLVPELVTPLATLARRHPVLAPEWSLLVDRLPEAPTGAVLARGYLEAVLYVKHVDQIVAVGWVVGVDDLQLWLEDEQGGRYAFSGGHRLARPDVHAAFCTDFGADALNSGFIVRQIVDGPLRLLRLRMLGPAGPITLAEVAATPMEADPLKVSRWLFGIQTPEIELGERFVRVDGPLVEACQREAQAQWRDLPVIARDFGRLPGNPTVSIIVPLFGRAEFMESQMLGWAADPWIRAHAELVYVIDDPTLDASMRAIAEELHRLYRIPFRCIWGGINRGYSGANNLGAAHATGEYLLFLNSDVFPQQAGWLPRMIDVLECDPEVGVVGARLTFAEGGIQHAGMVFERLDEYDVWINKHPMLGFDPALDPATGPTAVPAVTGACLLVQRGDFDAIGGWDTGYVIGDFEDSDLCLKMRSRGRQIVYVPDVQLTHLERQSMSRLGEPGYRMRVTLWNGYRHQNRWRPLIEALAGEQQ